MTTMANFLKFLKQDLHIYLSLHFLSPSYSSFLFLLISSFGSRPEKRTWFPLKSELISLFLGALCLNFIFGTYLIMPGMSHLNVCLSS